MRVTTINCDLCESTLTADTTYKARLEIERPQGNSFFVTPLDLCRDCANKILSAMGYAKEENATRYGQEIL